MRLFKLAGLEDICEDYGQLAVHRGTISGSAASFRLDDHHLFEAARPALVCGNTAAMLSETRLGRHFTVTGDRTTHFGPFPCGPAARGADAGASPAGEACSGAACC